MGVAGVLLPEYVRKFRPGIKCVTGICSISLWSRATKGFWRLHPAVQTCLVLARVILRQKWTQVEVLIKPTY